MSVRVVNPSKYIYLVLFTPTGVSSPIVSFPYLLIFNLCITMDQVSEISIFILSYTKKEQDNNLNCIK